MKLSIIGTGYVGLVSGACLADVGNDVLCYDRDQKKIEALCNGDIPIYEPGLKEVVQRNLEAGRLQFSSTAQDCIKFGDIMMIAVGTPSDEDGSADLRHVLDVAKTIGSLMDRELVIVSKSTVPVGTAELIRKTIQSELDKRKSSLSFSVVSNPEFLKEGAAVEDFLKPDRIIVGTDDERGRKALEELYDPFQRNHHKVIFMDIKSSELTKYASNAMLATRISFMNELARLSESLGADIEAVRQGMGADPRIGFHFLYPGVGYGGSCFPKDIKALIKTGKDHDIRLAVLESVEYANNLQKVYLTKKLKNFIPNLKGKTIGVWGLSFKPNTDDMRDAPSIDIINSLVGEGALIRVYDPIAIEQAQKVLPRSSQITYVTNAYSALEQVEALLLITEWKEFKSPDFNKMKSLMKRPLIIDGRNQYRPQSVRSLGFEYSSIGRQ